jgi:hypothetical protein
LEKRGQRTDQRDVVTRPFDQTRELTSSPTVRSGRSLALGRYGDPHPSGIVHGALRFRDGGHSLLASSENGLLVPVVRLEAAAEAIKRKVSVGVFDTRMVVLTILCV